MCPLEEFYQRPAHHKTTGIDCIDTARKLPPWGMPHTQDWELCWHHGNVFNITGHLWWEYTGFTWQKGQWCGTSLLVAWISCWTNSQVASDMLWYSNAIPIMVRLWQISASVFSVVKHLYASKDYMHNMALSTCRATTGAKCLLLRTYFSQVSFFHKPVHGLFCSQ